MSCWLHGQFCQGAGAGTGRVVERLGMIAEKPLRQACVSPRKMHATVARQVGTVFCFLFIFLDSMITFIAFFISTSTAAYPLYKEDRRDGIDPPLPWHPVMLLFQSCFLISLGPFHFEAVMYRARIRCFRPILGTRNSPSCTANCASRTAGGCTCSSAGIYASQRSAVNCVESRWARSQATLD